MPKLPNPRCSIQHLGTATRSRPPITILTPDALGLREGAERRLRLLRPPPEGLSMERSDILDVNKRPVDQRSKPERNLNSLLQAYTQVKA
jgi:hypothetical protein